jgi:indolepyruvate ferredoxin oxidoreductase alpha subunit
MHKLLIDSPDKEMLLLGNEAIARGAIEAGIGVASCYPGTPTSDIPDTFFNL